MFSERAGGKRASNAYTGISILYLRNLGMCCFQTTLEIGECFHKLSRTLPRSSIDFVPRAQVSNEAREKTFDSAHRHKRKMRYVMFTTTYETAYLVSEERAEIDVRQNEFNALDIPIKTGALRRK
jgi:hypothetical protein